MSQQVQDGEQVEIKRGDLSLTYLNSKDSTLSFKLNDRNNQNTELFDISLKYWQSYVKYDSYGPDNWEMNSGAYVFRPMSG